MNYDARIDEYIAKKAPFAQEIMQCIRSIIHEALPHIEETIKWGSPFFTYDDIIIGSMAAFKAHCTFTFWNAALMSDPDDLLSLTENHSMGHLPKMRSVADVPNSVLFKKYLKEAATIEKNYSKLKGKKVTEIPIPTDFATILAAHPEAQALFQKSSPSFRKEYIEWFQDAKRAATKTDRMRQAIEWISEGKSRHWKYEKK